MKLFFSKGAKERQRGKKIGKERSLGADVFKLLFVEEGRGPGHSDKSKFSTSTTARQRVNGDAPYGVLRTYNLF